MSPIGVGVGREPNVCGECQLPLLNEVRNGKVTICPFCNCWLHGWHGGCYKQHTRNHVPGILCRGFCRREARKKLQEAKSLQPREPSTLPAAGAVVKQEAASSSRSHREAAPSWDKDYYGRMKNTDPLIYPTKQERELGKAIPATEECTDSGPGEDRSDVEDPQDKMAEFFADRPVVSNATIRRAGKRRKDLQTETSDEEGLDQAEFRGCR